MKPTDIIEASEKLRKDWFNSMIERDMELRIEEEHCEHFFPTQ